jgi:hypothetical protein
MSAVGQHVTFPIVMYIFNETGVITTYQKDKTPACCNDGQIWLVPTVSLLCTA